MTTTHRLPRPHGHRHLGPLRWLLLAVAVASGAGVRAQTSTDCGDLKNGYGPFDYRKDRAMLPVVEEAHFLPQVEALISGVSGPLGAELDYTLRAFPNHHRALLALSRLTDRQKNPKPHGAKYTIDCYFDRALRFRPDDTTARMLFVQHLSRTGRAQLAMSQLDEVVKRGAENGFTQYNAGLLYLELKQPERALEQAHRAMALGFSRTDLRQALVAAGKWREPPSPAEAASAPAAEPASLPASAASPASR